MSGTTHLDLGDYKKKLENIADNEKRSMTSQVKYWIDKYDSGDKE